MPEIPYKYVNFLKDLTQYSSYEVKQNFDETTKTRDKNDTSENTVFGNASYI